MKKINRIISILCISMFFLSSCSSGAKTKGFELGYYDGSNYANGYDTDLLYKNNSDFWGGDSGVFYVEEDGTEYGGYFYQYMSGCAGVNNGSSVTETEDGEKYRANIAVTRSKDLNDWELCGAVDGGFALKTGINEWVEAYVWAPEVTVARCDCEGECTVNYHGKYFMYFSAATPNNDGSIEGANYLNSTDWKDRLNLGIAISDTPVGPFKLVTSENVYGSKTAKNLNGQVVTSINPSISMREEFGLDYEWSSIDMHPFYDENGDFYLYFVKHITSKFALYTNPMSRTKANGNQIWGIKMKDMITPDFNTLTKVMANGAYTTCEYVGDKQVTYTTDGTNFYDYYDLYTDTEKAITPISVKNGVYKLDIPLSTEFNATTNKLEVKESMTQYIATNDGGKTYLAYKDESLQEPIIGYLDGARFHDYNYMLTNLYPDGTVNDVDYYDPENADGSIAEAPQIITTKNENGETMYLLTYSPYGVASAAYDVRFAYSTSPLSGFVKAKSSEGRSILDFDKSKNDFMTNLGHAAFVSVADELWCVHWECPAPNSGSVNPGRLYAVTRMAWINQPALGFDIPVANGPSKTLQPLPAVYTGYRNVAKYAKVTATNDIDNTAKYLNDDLVVTNILYEEREFKSNKGTTITLEFSTPVSIRGIFIYNSYNNQYAFDKVDVINFTLAEKPAWYQGESTECNIQNLAMSSYNGKVYPGSAALATFAEMKVSKIEIRISCADGARGVGVSDIYVMGK